jgi:sugar lactone lactonase YvrE
VDENEAGLKQPNGLAFSPSANAFYVIEQAAAPGTVSVVKLTPFGDRLDTVTIPTPVGELAAVAFDSRFGRLLMLDAARGELLSLAQGPDGGLNPAGLTRYPIGQFGVQQATAMTVDSGTGRIYFLDGTRLVAVDPTGDGGLAGATASVVDLAAASPVDPHGLALDPASGHLHVMDAATQRLYEVTAAGELVASRDLAQFNLAAVRDMLFAPSGDLTDEPEQAHLYLLNSAARGPQILEFSLAEFSAQDDAVMAAALTYQSTVIQTMVASNWSPSSPDSSGIAYLPHKNRLLVSDGEVDETVVITNTSGMTQSVNLYEGVNMWEVTLDEQPGPQWTTLVDPNTGRYSDEPTGVAFNPANNHLFITDDTGRRSVYEVNPGPDGNYGTADDAVTRFTTGTYDSSSGFGSLDPEGITYAPDLGVLFIIDGLNREIYRVAPGPNGRFNGVAPEGDDSVTHFDVEAIGVTDPEGIAYNANTGTLFIAGKNKRLLFEATTAGVLVRTIDVTGANGRHLAGLAYAPSSIDPNKMSIYVVDRGVDNGFLPDRYPNDGRVYEMTLPQIPVAVDDSATTPQGTAKIIDVAANDTDADANLDLTSVTTACSGCSTPSHGTLTNHGDGTFTYAPNAAYIGSDSFVYQICDGDALCDKATVSLSISGVNVAPVAADDSATTPQDTPKIIDVAANDTDPNGNLDPASVNTACGTCSAPSNGTLTNNGDGTLTYTPNAAYTGSDSFVYEICDSSGLCDTATVSITVNGTNDAPDAKDDNATTPDGQSVLIDVAANDTDADGNLAPASAAVSCGACTRPAHGSLTNHGDGTFTYMPDAGYVGSDTFVYQICDDGGLCDTATVTVDVTVKTTNTAPNAVADSATTVESEAVTINVAANDTDAENNLVAASAGTTCGDCVPPAHGDVTDNGDGTITYTPNPGFNGKDSFVYEICDSGPLCDIATVTVTVVADPTKNDPPVANDDSVKTDEETAIKIDVAANDTDPNDNLDPASANTACGGCSTPDPGTLTNHDDGTFTYTPKKGFSGNVTFVYQICDSDGLCDTATVTVGVTAIAVGGESIKLHLPLITR